MASSSQQLHEDPAYGFNRVKVTVLASEWGSSKGGLSTINRELAIQLAKCPEAEITLFLPQCNVEDKNVALSHNINIVEATRRPGFEELDWLSFPPENLQVDVIVGHGVKLGRQAQIIRDSHKCRWIQVVHTDPEELGMFKSYPNPISKGEEKHNVEVELCQMANFVVGIGPKLTEAFRTYLRWCRKDESIHDLTPGIFDEFRSVQQVTDEGKNCRILVFGRGDAEDFELKGFDIAGRAVASLPNAHLVFVGAPDGKHEEIAARLLKCGIPRNRLKVRGYISNRESLKHLFCEVDLVLMPSRTEGFGLTGLEALSAGLPVVVSRNSGFGQALIKVPFGSSFVIDSEEPKVWAAAIKEIWDKDREERLGEADAVRTSYGKKYSWAKQSKSLLQRMINLTQNLSSSCHSSAQSRMFPCATQVSQRTGDMSVSHPDLSSSCHSSAQSTGRMFPFATQASQRTGDMSVCHQENIFHDLQQMQCEANKLKEETELSMDLGRIASYKGFIISSSPASGDCMFYALSKQLHSVKGSKISQRELRKTLVRFLRENPNLRDGTPLSNFVSGCSSWRDYLQSMSKDGTWGDHLVLLATANCYQTAIRVISSLGREIVIKPEHPVANPNPLVLGHIHEEHYVSLHPRQSSSSISQTSKHSDGKKSRSQTSQRSDDTSQQHKDDSSNNETSKDSRGNKFPSCTQASQVTGDMTVEHEAASYPASIIERIRQLYKIREGRLLPLPWCNDFFFHLNDIFTRLKIVGKEMPRGTLTDEITDMTAIFKTHEDCKLPPRTVLIEGDPGMGKTTYCQKLAYDWATKHEEWDDSFPEIEVLLLLRCHDIKSDIWEAIDEQILPVDVDEEAKKNFFKFIRENQSKVLLVLDGLDEADPSKLKMYTNLLESKVLPDCHIVVTSRHESGKEVRRYMDSLWEIVGFTKRDAEDFIRKYFRTREHLGHKLCERLWSWNGWLWGDREKHLESVEGLLLESGEDLSLEFDEISSVKSDNYLRELTTNPLNTALLCVLWEDFEGILPKNSTALYVEIVSCVLLRYEKKNGISSNNGDPITVYKKELIHLGRMALQSLLEGELYIEEHKFDFNSTVLTKFGFLSIQSGGSKRRPCSRYGFLHKSFQEFFAGLYLAFQILNKELDCDSVVTDRRYSSELKQVFLFMGSIVASRSEETVVSLVASIAKHMNYPGYEYTQTKLEFALDCILEWKCLKENLYPQLLHTFGQNLNLKTLDIEWNGQVYSFDFISEALEVNTCLSGLDFICKGIGSHGSTLSEALKVNTCLTELVLNCTGSGFWFEYDDRFKRCYSMVIEYHGATSLSEALRVNACLTKLYLSGNWIGDSGAASLSEALKVNTCLTELDLSENRIGESGAAFLSEALKVNRCLTKLHLWLNDEIADSGAACLSEALIVNTCLTELNLCRNGIGNSGAASLSEALKVNTCLTELDLSLNGVLASGASSLSEALKVNTCLTKLDLGYNRIGDSGAASLSEALIVNTCLTGLDLTYNSIGASGAACLSEALKVNTCLTELDLIENGIGDYGAASLSEALKVNTCLTELNLSENRIGDCGAASLSVALKVNTCLTKLNLSVNGIGASGASSLSEALKVNTCLTELDLSRNGIGASGAACLSEALKVNTC